MKLIINIPEEKYLYAKNLVNSEKENNPVVLAIGNGTPIPDNATNGEVIKAMFDTTEEHFYDKDRMVDVYGLDRSDDPSTFYADWWNALYQKGDGNDI